MRKVVKVRVAARGFGSRQNGDVGTKGVVNVNRGSGGMGRRGRVFGGGDWDRNSRGRCWMKEKKKKKQREEQHGR